MEQMVKQSETIAEDSRIQHDKLRQKAWNLSKKVRLKNDELEEKTEECEAAIETALELRDRLLALGAELSDDESED